MSAGDLFSHKSLGRVITHVVEGRGVGLSASHISSGLLAGIVDPAVSTVWAQACLLRRRKSPNLVVLSRAMLWSGEWRVNSDAEVIYEKSDKLSSVAFVAFGTLLCA